MLRKVSEQLLRARRALDELCECEILQDWQWDESLELWYLNYLIEIDSLTGFPKSTHWYITASNEYPEGDINVYPAVEGGISDTYFHQANNGFIAENNLWRKGKLCLDMPGVIEGILPSNEPKGIDSRILWHVKRTIQWIKKQAQMSC